MKASALLYRLARAASWTETARRGPGALGRKAARRPVYRASSRAARRITRGLGL